MPLAALCQLLTEALPKDKGAEEESEHVKVVILIMQQLFYAAVQDSSLRPIAQQSSGAIPEVKKELIERNYNLRKGKQQRIY